MFEKYKTNFDIFHNNYDKILINTFKYVYDCCHNVLM